MPTLRPLIYNLHRLIDRSQSHSPTGVDRVDLRHALHLLEQAKQRQVLFIRQRHNVAYLVPFMEAEALIRNLEQRWIHGEKLSAPRKASPWQIAYHWLNMRGAQLQQNLIQPAIGSMLKDNRLKPIYLHSGHGTIHHLDLHQQIKTRWQADLVFYLHDLIPIDYPEYTNNPSAQHMHRRRMQTMATTGTLILANSEDSRRRFLNYCQQEGLPQPPVHVLLIGVEPQILAAARQPRLALPPRFAKPLNKPYFITIGTIEARKNHLLLLHLWRELAEELGAACPKLVILGKRGWKIEHLLHLLEKSPLLAQHVLEVNDANDHDMIALLQHANALLFPSFAEGWGMPLAEALSLDTPAICADIPALRECGRNHATYLSPLDGLGWKHAILQQMQQPRTIFNAPYQPDTWQDHLQQLAGFINQLDKQ